MDHGLLPLIHLIIAHGKTDLLLELLQSGLSLRMQAPVRSDAESQLCHSLGT